MVAAYASHDIGKLIVASTIRFFAHPASPNGNRRSSHRGSRLCEDAASGPPWGLIDQFTVTVKVVVGAGLIAGAAVPVTVNL